MGSPVWLVGVEVQSAGNLVESRSAVDPLFMVIYPKSVSWTVDIVLPDGSLNLYALVHGG